jgi:hypothetical protein
MSKLDAAKVYILLAGMEAPVEADLLYRKADQRPFFMLNKAPNSGGFTLYGDADIPVAGAGKIGFLGQSIPITLAVSAGGTDTKGRDYTAVSGSVSIGTDYVIDVAVRTKSDGSVSWKVNITAPRGQKAATLKRSKVAL